MLKRLIISAALVAVAGQAASAQGRIGTAVRVINKVTADKSAIVTGDGVSQNQTVETEADALGELRLDDDTKLALGPGAKLVLDKFVYDPSKSGGSVVVNLAKGAFRFVTGAAQKKDYTIKTPNASISVRGTVFDIYIAADGREWILIHEGAIDVCNKDNVCRKLTNPCHAVGLIQTGQIGDVGTWVTRRGSSEVDFDTAFPFVKTPPLVDFKFYHTRAEIESTEECPNPNAIKTQRAEIPASQPVYKQAAAPQSGGSAPTSGGSAPATTSAQAPAGEAPAGVETVAPTPEFSLLPPLGFVVAGGLAIGFASSDDDDDEPASP